MWVRKDGNNIINNNNDSTLCSRGEETRLAHVTYAAGGSCRWKITALVVFFQAVISFATVRLTWFLLATWSVAATARLAGHTPAPPSDPVRRTLPRFNKYGCLMKYKIGDWLLQLSAHANWLSLSINYYCSIIACSIRRAVSCLQRIVAGSLHRRHDFDSRPVHVGFMVERLALGLVYFGVRLIASDRNIPPMLHTHLSNTDAK